jgi:hypothetical protein
VAKVVKAIPPKEIRRRSWHYYDQYFDGRVWRLTLGEDCSMSSHVATGALHNVARRLGLTATVESRTFENAIYVQANTESRPKDSPAG